jgi:hypothetical protein
MNRRRGSTRGEAHRREAVDDSAWAKSDMKGGSLTTKLGQVDTGGDGEPCA